MRLLPTRRGATLHLAAHASIVVFAILTVCGLLDVAHVYIQYFFGEGYLTERPPRNTLYNIVLFWTTYAALVPCVLFLTEKYRLDLQSSPRKLFIHTGAAMAFA
jgi:hypothetical protein